MKKTIKMLGLLLVAAAMFLSCAQQAPEENKASKKDGLFPAGDTTIAMNSGEFQNINLPDGTWSFKFVNDESTNNGGTLWIEELTFTKTGTTRTITKGYKYQEGKIPANTPQAQIDAAVAQGYKINGDSYTYSKDWDASDIATAQARLDTGYLSNFYYNYNNGTLKRNAENTKFHSSFSGNITDGAGTVIGTYTANYWLKKN